MHKTPEIIRLVHDNFWIVLSFAFARPVVGKLINERFAGEWKYLRKSVYELAEIRAPRGHDAVRLASALALAVDDVVLFSADQALQEAARSEAILLAAL